MKKINKLAGVDYGDITIAEILVTINELIDAVNSLNETGGECKDCLCRCHGLPEWQRKEHMCTCPKPQEGLEEGILYAGMWHEIDCEFPFEDQAVCNCPKKDFDSIFIERKKLEKVIDEIEGECGVSGVLDDLARRIKP